MSDGSEFSATNPQTPPLLTISVPVGLQFNGLPQSIINEASLTIAPSQTIALVGGEILIKGSEITSESGRISLGAVQENSIVNLATDNLGWVLDYSQIQNGGDINISEASFLNVTGDTGGNIEIYGQNINVTEESYLQSDTLTFGSGSHISIMALDSVNVEDSGISTGISSNNEAEVDQAGDINITTNRLNVNRSQIGSLTEGTELGGDVNIKAYDSINLSGFSEYDDGIAPGGLFSQSFSDGDSGNIFIETGELRIQNGSVIDTATFGQGKSGNINIQASKLITLEGSDIQTGILAQTADDPSAFGDAGNITIATQQLNILDGAQILVVSRNGSQGGELTVNADNSILVSATNSIATPTSGQSSISVSAEPAKIDETGNVTILPGGNGGNLLINTNKLTVEKGAKISSDTYGLGNGGTLTLNVNQLNLLNGGVINSGSLVEENSPTLERGNGGTLTINANEYINISGSGTIGSNLIPVNSALITETQGIRGNAGELFINTPQLFMSNQGIITASTSGENANANRILIDNAQLVILDNSRILSLVDEGAIGNSGEIIINTNNLRLENSSVILTSTSGQGNAGAITINAQDSVNIKGIRDGLLSAIASEITETGRGDSGKITIETGTLTLNDGSLISANTFGIGNAGLIDIKATDSITLSGDNSSGFVNAITTEVAKNAEGNSEGIKINTSSLTLQDGAVISASTFSLGNTGLIDITATDSLTMSGENSLGFTNAIVSAVRENAQGDSEGIKINTSSLIIDDGSLISANTFGIGNAGLIEITATDSITILGEDSRSSISGIASEVGEGGKGNSGGIKINTGVLTINDGGLISASLSGEGKAGAIAITATDSITIQGEDSQGFGSDIASEVEETAIGDSGGITVDTSSLNISDGGAISTVTSGKGNAGKIEIKADSVLLSGKDNNNLVSRVVSEVDETGIGNSNEINITTTTLELNQGAAISASTFGQGNAGNININATDSVSLNGTSFNEDVNREVGGIFAVTFTDKNAGNINLDTGKLTISEGSGIETFTEGQGNAGDININTRDSIILDNDTKLIVETRNQGKAGNITIHSPTLTIGNNAELSAKSTDSATGENAIAGDITLNVNQLNIAGELGIFAETNSEANAGNLTIQPYQIIGQDAFPLNTNLNIQFIDNGFISARTTNSGDGGSITINTPENIYIRGLGSITAETSGNGKAGNINLTSKNITITDGVSINTSTESAGNAGLIIFNATESIFLTNQAQIISEVKQGAIGDSQGILINTPQLTIADNSQISAATQGEGKAGNIDILAESNVTITDNSLLNVQTDSIGEAGNINITTDILTIGENSELSAKTTINATGNAGNINIFANFLDIKGELGIFAETDGVADAGNLNINPHDNSDLTVTFGDKGQISASTTNSGNGGNININAPKIINLQGDGIIKVETLGSGKAGNILINSENINLSNGLEINASTQSTGDAGNINLSGNQINISQTNINAFTDGKGNAGSILIDNADNLNVTNNTQISTEIRSKGEANQPANITISSNRFNLNNSEITASTSGIGEGGNIFINAKTPLTLDNQAKITSALNEGGIGKGGNIIINAPSLNLDNDSQINASNAGNGEGGFVQLIIDDTVKLNNNSQIATAVEKTGVGLGGRIKVNTQTLNLDNQSQLRASTLGQGNADSILVNADNVTLTNGSRINTETDGQFQAGNITLNLKENLFISGNNSGLFANTQVNSTGNGGSININAPLLNIINEGEIAVNSLGSGEGGDITVNTNNLNLDNGDITTQTLSSDGGNLTLNIQNLLTLFNSSNITATAGTAQAGGDGGNILLNAPFIISSPANPFNAITANAFEGDGGNIDITTNLILGGEFFTISASSQLGLDGEVIIRNPNVDPTSGLISLDSNFVDVENLINQNACKFIGNKLAGSFYIIKKGGLPAQPNDFNYQNIILTPWLNLDFDTKEKPTNLSLSREKLTLPPSLSFSCVTQ